MFKEWYLENEHSEELHDLYREYLYDCQQDGIAPLIFKYWAKLYYKHLDDSKV